MRWILALMVVGALPSLAQVHCPTSKVGGFWTTDCEDLTPRPVTPLRPDPSRGLDAAIVTPEGIGAWRALEEQRLRIEEQRLRNEILRGQSERAAKPPSISLGLGTLAFTSGLAGVDVWLDGQWRGRTVAGPRLVVADLSPGQHWIEVRMADRRWAGAVTVEANERSVIDLDSLVSATPLGPTTNSPAPTPRTLPLQPEAAAQMRALVACKSEVGEVADETARTQRIRQCMARHGYPPTDR